MRTGHEGMPCEFVAAERIVVPTDTTVTIFN